MELGLLRLATLLYLAATLVALVGIAVRQELPRRLLPRLLLGGLGVHAAAIIIRSVAGGHIAVTTFAEALSFLAALLVAIFLAVQARRPLVALGAIVSGIMWAHEAWGRSWSTDPKLVFSLLTWAVYVVLLQGRMTAGWRGRWAATLTIAGFAVIVLSLVSVNMLALGNHGKAF